MDFDELSHAVKDAGSFSDVCAKFGKPNNGKTISWLKSEVDRLGIDTSHFCRNGGHKNRKYKLCNKQCPVCDKQFKTKKGHSREATTCSRSCSNAYFKDRRWHQKRISNYRTICFRHYKKECVICEFNAVVDVHHIDNNHENNAPENLAPVCRNHHAMLSTKRWSTTTEDALRECMWKKYGVQVPIRMAFVAVDNPTGVTVSFDNEAPMNVVLVSNSYEVKKLDRSSKKRDVG